MARTIRTFFLLALLSSQVILLVSTQLARAQAQPAKRPPNVILLIGDDHGWPYYGFMGSKDVLTPNLDLLARQGTVLPFAHSTSSVCRPALLSLLTGLYPYQIFHRIDHVLADKIEYREGFENYAPRDRRRWGHVIEHFQALPRLLASVGYVSFEGGKYWEGGYRRAGFTEGMSSDWNTEKFKRHQMLDAMAGADGLAFGRETSEPMYEFIRKNKEKPFFVWYAPMLPHTPHNPPYKYLKYYQSTDNSEATKKYYANCTWFDAGVGELVDFLHAEQLLNDTLLIYVNDNGWQQRPHDGFHVLGGPKGKNSLHDFGFRTPIIFHWPGKVPAGRRRQGLFSTLDLFPTILDYAGVETAPKQLPGRSLRQVVEAGASSSRSVLIGSMHQLRSNDPWKNHQVEGFYLRSPKWHYILSEELGIEELYDMVTDPEAEQNVIADNPELARRFRQSIEAWKRDVIDAVAD